ncbi:CYTH domain-containing protein [Rhizobium grahamii]|uniref:CYTH domain-containing protein n=1 Tax=Rhizobium grahamii TaxID=1120045 RepID=UPI001FD0472F|nr:CYTH domain-containing protein [Rhizobium grahamii]
MASGTEIKLDLSQEGFNALVGSDLLREPDKVLDQRSTYFDTADRRLWNDGYTLRIRQVGDTKTQTVKATGPSSSLFARLEWETPHEGDEPVLDHTSPLIGVFGSSLRLEPAFDAVVTRRLWNLQENGSRIEFVIDEGEVVSGDRRTPIREAEIELKDGSPSDLLVFARKIDGVAGFRIGVRSKSERGFALADAQKTVFKARNVDVLLAKAADSDLVSKLKTARATTYRDAINALASSRARALMLDLVDWLECGDHFVGDRSASSDILSSARDFAV